MLIGARILLLKILSRIFFGCFKRSSVTPRDSLRSSPGFVVWQRHHLVLKREKCSNDSKYIPGHRGNLHVIPKFGWSFLHLQTAGVNVQELQTSQFCWADESRPGTHCSDPTAWREAWQPPSSAERQTASSVNTVKWTGGGLCLKFWY